MQGWQLLELQQCGRAQVSLSIWQVCDALIICQLRGGYLPCAKSLKLWRETEIDIGSKHPAFSTSFLRWPTLSCFLFLFPSQSQSIALQINPSHHVETVTVRLIRVITHSDSLSGDWYVIDGGVHPFQTVVKWDRNTTWVMSEAAWVQEIWYAVASCVTLAELPSVNPKTEGK